MTDPQVVERRESERRIKPVFLRFRRVESECEFPGRCVDISKGGMLMYVPVATPVKVGQSLRVSVGSVDRPEFAALSKGPVAGAIVRVDRHCLLEEGYVAVGLRFIET